MPNPKREEETLKRQKRNKFVSVGKILNFHGIKGEAKVGYSQKSIINSLSKVFVLKAGEYISLEVSEVKFTARFAVIKFKGIDDINAISEYKGCLIFSKETDLKSNLGDDEFLTDELIGMTVISDKKPKGTVTGVVNNGANDLLCVKSNTKNDCLIPFVKELVLKVDSKKKEVIVKNIQGLIE